MNRRPIIRFDSEILFAAVYKFPVNQDDKQAKKKEKEDMINLHDKNTQQLIGEISEEQLQFLIDELVEEDSTDQDYYINRDQLDQLEKKGGDEALIQMLRAALVTKEDMDIIWTKSWTNDAQLRKIQPFIGCDSKQAANL